MIPINPFDRRARPDPYPVYHYMRSVEPVHKSPIGYWVLTRYADCKAVLESQSWSHDADSILEPNRGADEPVDPTVRLLRASVLFSDPPRHRRHVRALETAVRTSMKGLDKRSAQVAASLVRLMVEKKGKVDIVTDYASPLAVVVLGDLLGVPAADRVAIQRWGRDMASGLDPMVRSSNVIKAGAAAAAVVEYLLDRIDSADAAAGGALNQLAAMPRKLRTWELVADLAILILTGLEATTAFIGNAALALVHNPDQRRQLKAEPNLVAPAVEELLRFDGPIHLTARVAIEDVEVGDTRIAAGEQAIVLLGAANRDPARFQDADRLQITRTDNQHLAFGGGAHTCFAAPLARLIGGAAVSTLAELDLELAGEPSWMDTVTVRGLSHLPVTLST